MEPAHRSAHIPSHAAALLHFTLSHSPLCMIIITAVNVFYGNIQQAWPEKCPRFFKGAFTFRLLSFPSGFTLVTPVRE